MAQALLRAVAEAGLGAAEARMLLSHTSGRARATLIARPEDELGPDQVAAFAAAVERRRTGEPVAYVLGERAFHGIVLQVTPDVLIPRPETELLVDFALEKLPPGGNLLDLGTGSGAIALAVKYARPDAQVSAVEKNAAALAIARANAARLGLEVEFLHGHWFEPLKARRFNVVVSNPPYVAEGDRHLSEGDVRFEPRAALVGGTDGLADIRTIVALAPRHLGPAGWLAIEHGYDQAPEVRRLLASSGLEAVSSRPDLAGIARISIGKYNLE